MPASDSSTPWSYSGSAEAGYEVKDGAGRVVASTADHDAAKLIAAAPDLLVALENLVASGDDEVLEEIGVDSGPDFDTARAAISKARYAD